MESQPYLTKIQAALLDTAHRASTMIGTKGRIPCALLEQIAGHYFRRPDRVLRALLELERVGYLVPIREDRFRIFSLPTATNRVNLPGEKPDPLREEDLLAMLVHCNLTIVQTPIDSIQVVPVQPRKTDSASRGTVLLANHRLAEEWYFDALPSPFSRAIISIEDVEIQWSIQLRSKLAQQGRIRGLPTPGNRQSLRWQVTPTGLAYLEETRKGPSVTLDVIRRIARELGLRPCHI